MVSSRVYPDLERSPGKADNWVEKAGGLPDYIERIAKHLHYEKGMTISHAIATAVNAAKRMASTGDLNFPGAQQVNPGSRAQAVKAVAAWEAKKKKSIKASEIIELANAANRGQGASGSGKAFDETKYVRNPATGKFSQKFDSSSPEFIAARRRVEAEIANMMVGGSYNLPGEVGWVRRTPGGYMIQGGAGVRQVTARMDEAVVMAAQLLAGKLKELGGKA